MLVIYLKMMRLVETGSLLDLHHDEVLSRLLQKLCKPYLQSVGYHNEIIAAQIDD